MQVCIYSYANAIFLPQTMWMYVVSEVWWWTHLSNKMRKTIPLQSVTSGKAARLTQFDESLTVVYWRSRSVSRNANVNGCTDRASCAPVSRARSSLWRRVRYSAPPPVDASIGTTFVLTSDFVVPWSPPLSVSAGLSSVPSGYCNNQKQWIRWTKLRTYWEGESKIWNCVWV